MIAHTPWPECPTCSGSGYKTISLSFANEIATTSCPCPTCAAHWRGVDADADAAVKAEREVCLSIVNSLPNYSFEDYTPEDAVLEGKKIIADAIRARGGKGKR